ncbi:MAG: cytochrome-c oxidase, cbb3-type subunit III [Pseudomonadota bacterium]
MTTERDEFSGMPTTGHEWDGIKELKTPVPKAFHVVLALFVGASLIIWLLFPSFPTIRGYASGLLGYSSRTAVTEAVSRSAETRTAAFAPFMALGYEELLADAALRAEFEPAIGALYRENCAACHGLDLLGQTNFPNLRDDHWLWSGEPEEIEYSIRYGINANHDDTRFALMPAFGRDEILAWDEIRDVVEYVLQISGQDHVGDAAGRGEAIFAEQCASCHGDLGLGGEDIGAPSLVDEAWIYGGSREAVRASIRNGRAGVMPYWEDRLSDEQIRKLTLYVLWAGADQAADPLPQTDHGTSDAQH